MLQKTVRDYSKRGDALSIPNLVDVQQAAYERFLQKNLPHDKRDPHMGLEGLLKEVFPIESYDGNMHLEYVHYRLDEPRYTPDECRELRLTYGLPFRIRVRLVRKDVAEIPEEDIYLGEIPVLIGGGEYIINGAERVIVNQLHRSPGVDFSIASAEADRPLHSARIIPDRGSWIELEVSKKDVLQMRIDQSTKIPATTFLRAIDEKYSTTDALLRTFYDVQTVKSADLKPEHFVAVPIIDTETGEELVPIGAQVGEHLEQVQASKLKKIDIIANPGDLLILNTIADEKQAEMEGVTLSEYEVSLLALYARLRPGNPPQVDKAKQLIDEKFFDENRYRLGKVGRFRINRKFNFTDSVSFEDYINGLQLKCVPLEGVEGSAEIKTILESVERTLITERNLRFNSQKREPNELSSKASELLDRCQAAISSDNGWGTGFSSVPKDGFGIYFFRDGSEIVYIGQAKDRKDGGFKGRMTSHFRQKDDNLRRPINAWLESNSLVQMKLRAEDFLQVIKYLLDLRSNRNKAHIDDIDHLGNRRLRTLDELAVEEMRKGFLKLKRTVQERMSVKDLDELSKVADLVNSKSISSAIDHFFGRGELSQVVDQTNPLSMLTHERRLSALGPGGLNRKRAGFEVRDVHISHYGRICPIETPEGTNIGLIASLGLYSKVDEYGFLQTPYREVKDNKITGEITFLRADEEMKLTLGPADVLEVDGTIKKGAVLARVDGDLSQVPSSQIDYVDISPKQIVGVSAALIPFLEHDDANRALMGSNMQRQAVPLIKVDPPCVATGMEQHIPTYSGMLVRARNAGTVTYVDAKQIVIDNADEYVLRKFVGLNERTCQNQKPIVRLGQKVEKGQTLADGAATKNGELALGKNVLVAFNTFDGYNFEDAIVINERLVKDDTFTSIHIEDFDVEIRETKLGREEFTCDIPNVSEKMLSMLDEHGIIRTGAYVKPRDILVGKVSPKSKSELTPEEKLLHAIFGRAGEDVKNDSLEVPAGTEGIVIGAKRFSRRMHLSDEQKKRLRTEMREYEANMDDRAAELFRQMIEQINEATGTAMVDPSTRQKVAASDITEVILEQIESFDLKWIKGNKEVKEAGISVYNQFWPRIQAIEKEKTRKLAHMKRGDELPSGVLEMVKVYIATKRPLSVGDKMAGRHGNKGVIARIVPEQDMPFLDDGTSVDVLLNPLGVPSRMNVGQILETHLGWACGVLGFQAVTPVFDGATEAEIHAVVEEANAYCDKRLAETKGNHGPEEVLAKMPYGGKIQLYDGRTGEPFDERTTVGRMYIIKLHHLVDDKIHARATGPYSLITQQPLGGKARTGGQRFGEMEVWALEAYGAAYILQELLTVKSDDVEGRTKIYESMVKGTNSLEAGMPVAFDVLCNEVKGLGLNITLEKVELEGGSIL